MWTTLNEVYSEPECVVKFIDWYQTFKRDDGDDTCARVSWQGYAEPTHEPVSYVWHTEAWEKLLRENDIAENINTAVRPRGEDGIVRCDV